MTSDMRSAERRQLCRDLRQGQTPPEAIVWELVRNRRLDGLKFRRQHPLGRYVADFYCAEHRLVVELDGPIHRSRVEQDHLRDEAMRNHGIRVLRITNEELLRDPEEALRRVLGLTSVTPEPPLHSCGEGAAAAGGEA